MPLATTPRPWRSYVAIGDSFSEGLCDALPEGGYAGWTDRLAVMLAGVADPEPFSYANLAIRGRLLRQVADQVGPALALAPDLVSVSGGGNDCLRPGADPDALAVVLDDVVVRLRATGADVLLSTPTETRGAPVIERVRGVSAVFLAHTYTIAERHGCYLTNVFGLSALYDWRMWAEDRVHLTSEGHARVASEAFHALGHTPANQAWRTPLDPADLVPRQDRLRADVLWAKNHLAPWVSRRLTGRSSGDHLAPKRAELTLVDPRQPLPDVRY